MKNLKSLISDTSEEEHLQLSDKQKSFLLTNKYTVEVREYEFPTKYVICKRPKMTEVCSFNSQSDLYNWINNQITK